MISALKYSTAVPVIFLSALKYHVAPDRWTYFYRRLWLFSGVVNSLYSFYWDVTRDWDLRYVDISLFPMGHSYVAFVSEGTLVFLASKFILNVICAVER